jgi:hypothetical protein
MSYSYEAQRANIFTEDGQRMFLKIRDKTQYLLKIAGAVRHQEATSGVTGDSWDMIACLDRMVELGEIRELTQDGCPGQYRVFVAAFQ